MTKAGNYSIAVDTFLEYALGSVDGFNVAGQSRIQTNIAFLSSPVEVFNLMGDSHTKITSAQRERNLENRKQFFESSLSRLLGGQNNNNTVRKGIDETPLLKLINNSSS